MGTTVNEKNNWRKEQKNKVESTKSIETIHEQVGNGGNRTFSHVRHLPRFPLGNIGIKGSSTSKRCTTTRNGQHNRHMVSEKIEIKKQIKCQSTNQSRPFVIKWGTEVDVLVVMKITWDTFHFEISALKNFIASLQPLPWDDAQNNITIEVTPLVSHSAIGPYVDSMPLLFVESIQSSTIFKRPLQPPVLRTPQ
jgi:hypothetical protein